MQTNSIDSPSAGGVGTTLSLVLLGTLLIAAATMFCFQHLKPEIERDLTARVSTALQGAKNFKIDGQDVILSGTVASAAASDATEKTAAEVHGVSRVINNLTVAADTEEQLTDGEPVPELAVTRH